MKSRRIAKRSTETEFSNWEALPEGQKSFAVQLMHYFHYRPKLIPSSWSREEVLTWELYRALEVLPRSLFLEPLMMLCATTGFSAAASISELLRDVSNVRLVAHPRLGLGGNKRNSASDLGFGVFDSQRVWIEAKTAVIKRTVLSQQLQTHNARICELAGSAPCAIIALLPASQEAGSEPSIRWADIVLLLERALEFLRDHPSKDLTPGLILVANELRERIFGHVPRLVPDSLAPTPPALHQPKGAS